jgi:predicted transcriptional regulator
MSAKHNDEFLFIRLKPETKKTIAAIAHEEDRSMSSVVRRMVEQSLSIESRPPLTSSRKS